MAANASSQGSSKEYIVRVPKSTKKKYHMMRFNADLGADFFKSWTQCKMERENNLKEYRMEDEMPKFGAGSEFGREQREEARRKKYGINVRKYKSEDQPWLLNVGGKTGKKYKGIREGGVAENVSWYVFMQGKDGAFEAYPVEEWYNFQPIQRYKALSAEEAEEEFVRRDKIMNYFQVMYEKKFKKEAAEVDDEEGKKKGSKKSLMLSEMDDWVSEDEDEGEEDENMGDDDSDGGKKKKKKRVGRKKQTGGKKKAKEDDHSDNSCEEESDDFNEGQEHDYISSDSSDSDQENEEIVGKELAGVEEGDALKKLLASDEEDENEENKDKEGEEEEDKEEESEDKEKKKKKKKKNDKKSDKDSEDSSDPSSDESKKKKDAKYLERKNAVNELKKRVKENPHEMAPDAKRMKMDSSAGGPSSADSMEETIRRYLMRKPMTTTELLKAFKKKKEKDLSSEQLVTSIAQVLKRVNPNKRMIKGKMYLSLKTS